MEDQLSPPDQGSRSRVFGKVAGLAVGAGLGTLVAWGLVVTLLVFLVTFFAKGPEWSVVHVYPILRRAGTWALIAMVVSLPLSFFRTLRAAIGALLFIGAHVVAAAFWAWCVIVTYDVGGGMFAVVLGLLFGGVGVIPISVVAALIKTEWALAGVWLFQLVAFLVFRFLAMFVISRAEVQE